MAGRPLTGSPKLPRQVAALRTARLGPNFFCTSTSGCSATSSTAMLSGSRKLSWCPHSVLLRRSECTPVVSASFASSQRLATSAQPRDSGRGQGGTHWMARGCRFMAGTDQRRVAVVPRSAMHSTNGSSPGRSARRCRRELTRNRPVTQSAPCARTRKPDDVRIIGPCHVSNAHTCNSAVKDIRWGRSSSWVPQQDR